MEVIKSKANIIDHLISLVIELAWHTKLGNRLIEKRELKLTTKNLENINSKLKETLFTIRTTEKTIIPMGTLLDEPNEKVNDYYFLLISNDDLVVAIYNLKNNFSKFNSERTISKKQAKNAILYWFRDWQINPKIIKKDLETIKEKIKKGG